MWGGGRSRRPPASAPLRHLWQREAARGQGRARARRAARARLLRLSSSGRPLTSAAAAMEGALDAPGSSALRDWATTWPLFAKTLVAGGAAGAVAKTRCAGGRAR